jgi:alkanesulfonate monooxygenase SsuD/methylene tetrahydromethanopterin reductase-like flavin-dependent oxidoreductase (luciferase family)
MLRIGFLSFGHWGPGQGSQTRTAGEALLQGIELAVAAEELGIDGATVRFGKTYAGAPDVLAEQLAADAAVQSADTLLLTVPNQLGVDFNAKMLGNIARHIAPAVGWTPAGS